MKKIHNLIEKKEASRRDQPRQVEDNEMSRHGTRDSHYSEEVVKTSQERKRCSSRAEQKQDNRRVDESCEGGHR